MSPKLVTALKQIATVIAGVLGSLAATNAFPAWTPVISLVTGLLVGWITPDPKAKVVSPEPVQVSVKVSEEKA